MSVGSCSQTLYTQQNNNNNNNSNNKHGLTVRSGTDEVSCQLDTAAEGSINNTQHAVKLWREASYLAWGAGVSRAVIPDNVRLACCRERVASAVVDN